MKKPLLFRVLALVFALTLLCSAFAMAETRISGGKYTIAKDGDKVYVTNGNTPVTNLILCVRWTFTMENGTSFTWPGTAEYSEKGGAYFIGVPDYQGIDPDYTLIIAAEERASSTEAYWAQLDRLETCGVAEANANGLGYALFK